jgi:heme/copper-type cytochrome/quinol oxidase subunit 2
MPAGSTGSRGRSTRDRAWQTLGAVLALLLATPGVAHASMFSAETEDKIATFIALFVIFVVPVVLIVAFWLVHILPEQIAHKRNHPQFEAIRTLCLLSLVFGGLLWPIAWLWAYSKPVLHKMAYGTDKLHDEHAAEGEADLQPGATLGLRPAPTLGLHDRLARLERQGVAASELSQIRADLEALEAKFTGQGAR